MRRTDGDSRWWNGRRALSIVMSAALIAGCDDRSDREAMGAYDAALSAAFDSLRLQPAHLVFADRYVSLESFMNTEPGPQSVFEDLAARHPNSRICVHDACVPEPGPGETFIYVSRIARTTPGEVAVAVLTYHYAQGDNVFGDGFRMRLTHDGEAWVPLRVVREWVPE